SRRRHTRFSRDWSSDVCSSDLGSAARAIVPRGPFTEMVPLPRLTSTPFGTGIGYFAIRDIAFSGHDAENFAAHAVGARLAVGHRSEERRVGKEGRSSLLPWHGT